MAKKRTIKMSEEEITRSEILRMADEKRITQKTGARRTGVTERHFRIVWLRKCAWLRLTITSKPTLSFQNISQSTTTGLLFSQPTPLTITKHFVLKMISN